MGTSPPGVAMGVSGAAHIGPMHATVPLLVAKHLSAPVHGGSHERHVGWPFTEAQACPIAQWRLHWSEEDPASEPEAPGAQTLTCGAAYGSELDAPVSVSEHVAPPAQEVAGQTGNEPDPQYVEPHPRISVDCWFEALAQQVLPLVHCPLASDVAVVKSGPLAVLHGMYTVADAL